MTAEETKQKAKFIELVESLKTRPVVRSFGNNVMLQVLHDKGVEYVKSEILTDETIALLGDDYEATKTTIDALQ